MYPQHPLPRRPPAAPCFFHHPPPPSPPFLLPRSQRSVLTVSRHPSGLSSVAPGRLARTAWDSAHFPALIIPGCSAGTSPCHSGLRRPLFHLLLFSLLLCRPLSVPPSIRAIIALPPHDPSRSLHFLFSYTIQISVYDVCLCVNACMHRDSQTVPSGFGKSRGFTRRGEEMFISGALSGSMGFPHCLTAIAISSWKPLKDSPGGV